MEIIPINRVSRRLKAALLLLFLVILVSTNATASTTARMLAGWVMDMMRFFIIFTLEIMAFDNENMYRLLYPILVSEVMIKPTVDQGHTLQLTGVVMQAALPVVMLMIVYSALKLIVSSLNPGERFKAKQQLKNMLVALILMSLAPALMQLMIDVNYSLTKALLVGSGSPYRQIMGAEEYGALMTKVFSSFSGTGSIYVMTCSGTISILAFVTVFLRYILVNIYSAIFPLTIMMYMFDFTKSVGRNMLKQTIGWIFTPVIMAAWLCVSAAFMLTPMSEANAETAVWLYLATTTMIVASPLMVTGVLSALGNIVTSIGQLMPSVAGVGLVTAGEIMQGQGAEAVVAAGIKQAANINAGIDMRSALSKFGMTSESGVGELDVGKSGGGSAKAAADVTQAGMDSAMGSVQAMSTAAGQALSLTSALVGTSVGASIGAAIGAGVGAIGFGVGAAPGAGAGGGTGGSAGVAVGTAAGEATAAGIQAGTTAVTQGASAAVKGAGDVVAKVGTEAVKQGVKKGFGQAVKGAMKSIGKSVIPRSMRHGFKQGMRSAGKARSAGKGVGGAFREGFGKGLEKGMQKGAFKAAYKMGGREGVRGMSATGKAADVSLKKGISDSVGKLGTNIRAAPGRMLEGIKNLPGRALQGIRNMPGRVADFAKKSPLGRSITGGRDLVSAAREGYKTGGIKGMGKSVGNKLMEQKVPQRALKGTYKGAKKGAGIVKDKGVEAAQEAMGGQMGKNVDADTGEKVGRDPLAGKAVDAAKGIAGDTLMSAKGKKKGAAQTDTGGKTKTSAGTKSSGVKAPGDSSSKTGSTPTTQAKTQTAPVGGTGPAGGPAPSGTGPGTTGGGDATGTGPAPSGTGPSGPKSGSAPTGDGRTGTGGAPGSQALPNQGVFSTLFSGMSQASGISGKGALVGLGVGVGATLALAAFGAPVGAAVGGAFAGIGAAKMFSNRGGKANLGSSLGKGGLLKTFGAYMIGASMLGFGPLGGMALAGMYVAHKMGGRSLGMKGVATMALAYGVGQSLIGGHIGGALAAGYAYKKFGHHFTKGTGAEKTVTGAARVGKGMMSVGGDWMKAGLVVGLTSSAGIITGSTVLPALGYAYAGAKIGKQLGIGKGIQDVGTKTRVGRSFFQGVSREGMVGTAASMGGIAGSSKSGKMTTGQMVGSMGAYMAGKAVGVGLSGAGAYVRTSMRYAPMLVGETVATGGLNVPFRAMRGVGRGIANTGRAIVHGTSLANRKVGDTPFLRRIPFIDKNVKLGDIVSRPGGLIGAVGQVREAWRAGMDGYRGQSDLNRVGALRGNTQAQQDLKGIGVSNASELHDRLNGPEDRRAPVQAILGKHGLNEDTVRRQAGAVSGQTARSAVFGKDATRVGRPDHMSMGEVKWAARRRYEQGDGKTGPAWDEAAAKKKYEGENKGKKWGDLDAADRKGRYLSPDQRKGLIKQEMGWRRNTEAGYDSKQAYRDAKGKYEHDNPGKKWDDLNPDQKRQHANDMHYSKTGRDMPDHISRPVEGANADHAKGVRDEYGKQDASKFKNDDERWGAAADSYASSSGVDRDKISDASIGEARRQETYASNPLYGNQDEVRGTSVRGSDLGQAKGVRDEYGKLKADDYKDDGARWDAAKANYEKASGNTVGDATMKEAQRQETYDPSKGSYEQPAAKPAAGAAAAGAGSKDTSTETPGTAKEPSKEGAGGEGEEDPRARERRLSNVKHEMLYRGSRRRPQKESVGKWLEDNVAGEGEEGGQ
ncbi:MAG: hypothetical protein ABIH11_02975 [Candidatus Altiarchaeota archaeon]